MLPFAVVLSLSFQVPQPALAPAALAAHRATPLLMGAKAPEKQTIGQKLWAINTGNKMKMVKTGQKSKVGGKRLPPEALEIVKTKFKKEYPQKDVEVLWGALLACYGTQERALQAARDNYQILNPSYSFPNTMIESRDVLFDMMGKEEALEVMMLNPAVLQCGPGLDTLGPDEIKGFANIRAIGKKIPDNIVFPAIILLIVLIGYPLLAVRVPELENSPLTNIIKPIVGILFAVAIEGSRIAIVGTIVKAKMGSDEKAKKAIEKAEANERRKMGGKKSRG